MENEVKKAQDLQNEIETLIDKHGVGNLLNSMANVCFEKAIHIRENWQDVSLAKDWDKNGQKIARIILI